VPLAVAAALRSTGVMCGFSPESDTKSEVVTATLKQKLWKKLTGWALSHLASLTAKLAPEDADWAKPNFPASGNDGMVGSGSCTPMSRSGQRIAFGEQSLSVQFAVKANHGDGPCRTVNEACDWPTHMIRQTDNEDHLIPVTKTFKPFEIKRRDGESKAAFEDRKDRIELDRAITGRPKAPVTHTVEMALPPTLAQLKAMYNYVTAYVQPHLTKRAQLKDALAKEIGVAADKLTEHAAQNGFGATLSGNVALGDSKTAAAAATIAGDSK